MTDKLKPFKLADYPTQFSRVWCEAKHHRNSGKGANHVSVAVAFWRELLSHAIYTVKEKIS